MSEITKKELFAITLINNIGAEIKEIFLLEEIFLNKNDKNSWTDVILSDSSGKITGKIWSQNESQDYKFLKGKPVIVHGMVELYKDLPTINIKSLTNLSKFDPRDLYKRIYDTADLETKLYSFLEQVEEGYYLKDFTKYVLESVVKLLKNYPAGTSSHNYMGGLLVHTVETVTFALNIANNSMDLFEYKPYRDYFEKNVFLDIDLVICSSILHDLGKLKSFNVYHGLNERGMQVPSSVESIIALETFAAKSELNADLTDLRHIIMAVSGSIEPLSYEAIIVSSANNLSKVLDKAQEIKADSQHISQTIITNGGV